MLLQSSVTVTLLPLCQAARAQMAMMLFWRVLCWAGWGLRSPGGGERLWARGGICLLDFIEGGSWIILFLVPFKYGASSEVVIPFKLAILSSSSAAPAQSMLYWWVLDKREGKEK